MTHDQKPDAANAEPSPKRTGPIPLSDRRRLLWAPVKKPAPVTRITDWASI